MESRMINDNRRQQRRRDSNKLDREQEKMKDKRPLAWPQRDSEEGTKSECTKIEERGWSPQPKHLN